MHIASVFPARRAAGLCAGLFAGVGMGCKSTSPSPGPTPTQLALVVFPSTQAINGAPLAQQPVVQVEDANGDPVAVSNRLVVAALSPPGAALSGTTEVRTDDQGRAAFTGLTITGPVGERVLRFESSGLRSVTAAPIQLAAGTAADLTIVSGNLQTAQAGTAVPVLPAVQVSDGTGNPVAGAPVEFAVTGGGGTVAGGAAVTGADGRASPTTWTLGNDIGLNTLTASSSAVPGSSVVFTATGVLGPPAILTLMGGDGQTVTVGGVVPIAPSVKLTDALGHPLPNVAVSFTVSAGGGTVTGGNPLTNASGIATVGSWALGLPPGPNTLTASRAGVPSVVVAATGVDFVLDAVEAGGDHSCGLAPGGLAYCWGSNQSGQVGNGANADVAVPTAVSGGKLFSSITVGFFHSCGLVAGSAWCWGSNTLGQLGDGTTINRTEPVPVAGGHVFAALDAGDQFTCGLLADGNALCWGRNATGQLGDGTLGNRLVPTPVSGGHTFATLDAGSVHTCAREASGALYCWGSNGSGRLGDGTTDNRNVPTPVIGGLSFAAAVAGDSYTCGITGAGSGYCWGSGAFGFLGTGNTNNQSSPTPISGSLVLSAISSSGGHTCALTAAGAAHCWGANSTGQIGDGTLLTRMVPTPVLGGVSFTRIRAGTRHTCGLGPSGSTYCWGSNQFGGVRDGTTTTRSKPVGVVRP